METPEISDGILRKRMRTIKQVRQCSILSNSTWTKLVRDDIYGDLYLAKVPGDPREVFFDFHYEPTRNKARRVNPEPFKTIQTIHPIRTGVCFRYSLAEILAQIPEEDIKRCVAFKVGKHQGYTENNKQRTANICLYERINRKPTSP